MKDTNFYQVGEMMKCGHCHPNDFQAIEPCRCVCHHPQSSWEERFDELPTFKKIFHKIDGTTETQIFVLIDKSFISQEISRARAETEKAFGGCKECYGKGYATTRATATSRYGTFDLDPIRPCSCDRGKQIKDLLK